MGKNEVPRYVNEDNCLKCKICYLICPQTDTLNLELQEKFGWKLPIGEFLSLASAQTTNKEVEKICTDGGVVTSLLLYLLERNLINGAIVSRKIGRFARESMVARTSEELIDASGSTFSGSLQLEELGGKYSTYTPILSTVKSLAKGYLHDIAVVGTPCQINSIRKMQCLGIIPAHLIKYTIGLFCIENFSFDDVAREMLEKKLDINLEKIVKLNMKDDFIISLTRGVTIHVPLEEVHEVARPACFTCKDFSNEYADISVGGLASPNGYTTTLIRTKLGASVYNGALRNGYIKERAFENSVEERMAKKKMLAKIISFARMKRMRAEERLS
ncbi:MAG: Coenzyme F420 hydrogenase/dehydrogenase, beta subunit C-terminal domain [Candidatus Bathyarchaeota archaeon]|nr:MAG: Coenzyme F420 hydrogenase/dehydrogenase, beta subunit C-terminal domain [Candidatus Bathyarchaeota archaeon]